MSLEKGFSPKSMGLIFMYDNTKNHGSRFNGAYNLEYASDAAFGLYGLQPNSSTWDRYQFDTIPLKYQGGLLVVAKSPEPAYRNYNPVAIAKTLKEFIDIDHRIYFQNNHKKKGYDGTVPEEVDWFFVKDIEVYLSDSDTVKHTDDATIDVMNYYAVPTRTSGKNLKMTSTVDDGGNKGMIVNRNESAIPLQGAIGETAIGRKQDSPLYPKKTYDVSGSITGSGGQVSFIAGLIDETYKMPQYNSYVSEQLLVMYPDGPDVYNTSLLVNPRDFYYQGNKLFQLEVNGERNSKHFLSQKLQTLSGVSVGNNDYNVNNFNVSTLTNSNLDGGMKSLHGMGIFFRNANLWNNGNEHHRMNYITMNYDPLSIYNYALPSFSARTPFNLGKEYRDTQLTTMDTILTNKTLKAFTNVPLDELFIGWRPSEAVIINLIGLGFDLANRHATLTDLDNSYSDELHVAESSTYAITSDRGERWTYTIPQTEIIQFENEFKNGGRRRNKDNPFYKVPINKLFKSVPEFYDYVSSLGIDKFQKINLEPYINSEYDVVWELWSQMRHHKHSSDYYRGGARLGYFRRKFNDADVDY